MKNTQEISRAHSLSYHFPKHLFWDVDMSQLDYELDKDLIIPRALYFSTDQTFDQDIRVLEKLYSPEDIRDEINVTEERISQVISKLVADRYRDSSYSFNA